MDIEREQVRENLRMKEHRKRMTKYVSWTVNWVGFFLVGTGLSLLHLIGLNICAPQRLDQLLRLFLCSPIFPRAQ